MDHAAIDAMLRGAMGRYVVTDPALDAGDLCQTAWLRGLDRLAAIPTDAERAAYLVRLARNAGVDAWRRHRRRPTVPLDDALAGAGDAAEEAVAALALVAAAVAAPPAVLLHALGYGWEEVGARTGQCANTAKTGAFRWRRRAREGGGGR